MNQQRKGRETESDAIIRNVVTKKRKGVVGVVGVGTRVKAVQDRWGAWMLPGSSAAVSSQLASH